MRPTKEQIDVARKTLAAYRAVAFPGIDIDNAVATLLAATTEPTDEELTQEVVEFLSGIRADGPCDNQRMRTAYIAGARREGAK